MTKRITALLLSVLLCLSLAGTAFAAGEESTIRGTAGTKEISVDLKNLIENAPYYLCSLLVKESEEAAETDFKIVESFNFRAKAGGTFTHTFQGGLIPTLQPGNVLRLRVPGVDFGGEDYIEYTVPESAGAYEITFDLNYEGASAPTKVETSGDGTVAEWPAGPVREGYTFLGWFDAAEGGEEVDSSHVFTADTTLYAHWQAGPVTAVSLPKTLKVTVKGTKTLTAALTPAGGEYASMEWASSDESIAAVTAHEDGASKAAVKGVKIGKANITVTVTSANGETYTASCEVTVSRQSSGGGGGGGGSSSSGYRVSVNSMSHGSVSTSPSRPSEGQTVTITVRPDKGYELDKLTVKGEDGKTIRTTKEGENEYTFTMPDGDVEISATFKAVEEVKEPAKPANVSFSDVPAGFWAYDQITWAANKGIMGGYGSGIFAPNRNVTRQQLWMVLGRLNGSHPADMAAARSWAISNGVSDGSNPSATMSRQQMVTMLYRYAQQKGYAVSGSVDLGRYPDSASVAGYAKEAVSWAVANGIMGGTSAGLLNPTGTASRAHFAVFMYRFCMFYEIA